MDMMVLLSANMIGGVSRVWSNSKLVYTALTSASSDTLRASLAAEVWRRMTVYSGDAAQLPDPTYEAAVGAGNAPAYRGRGVVMLEGLNLGSGGQVPNLTFEVFTSATETVQALDLWAVGNGTDGPGYARQGAPGFGSGLQTVLVPTWNALFSVPTVSVVTVGAGVPATTAQFDVYVGGGNPVLVPGVSDVTSLVLWRDGSAYVEIYRTDGSRVECTFASATIAGQRSCMCLRGTQILFGASGAADKIVYLFSSVNSGPAAIASPVLAQGVKRLAISSTAFYALAADGSAVYELNGGSLALNATIATPATASTVMCDDDGTLWLMAGSTLYRRDGAAWTVVQASIPANLQTSADDENGPSMVAGVLYNVRPSGTVPSRIYSAYAAIQTYAPLDEPLDDVVQRLCLRTGLAAPQVDVSLIGASSVQGFAIGQVSTTRQALDILAAAYLFEAVESGDVVKFVPRGGASVVTIPYDAMGASTGDPTEPLPIARRNDDETPALMVVRYSNADNDYQDGSETSDRLVGAGTGIRTVEVPLALTPTAAKRLADVYIHDISVSDLALGPVAVSRDYAALEPTDVVTLTDVDGSTYRARITKLTDSGGVRSFDAVIDDASVLTSSGSTAGGYDSSTTLAAPADTLLYLLDIPILRDADDASGIYAAARGATTPWPGAAVMDSSDAVAYTELVRVLESAVAGVCLTTLGAWTGGRVFDEVNTVRVNLGSGTAASVSRDVLLGDQTVNAWLIGSEIIQARDAALVSAGVYDLSGLLRGGRGTEWAMASHVAAERCVKLQPAGLRRVPIDTSRIGLSRYYKGVTLGRAIGTAAAQSFADTGVDRKPFSPFDARVARDGSNNCTITWQRRSRLAVRTTGPLGVSVPLGEESESYSIDVYDDATFTTVVDTLSATTPSVAYSAAAQTTAGLTPGDPLYLRVYQLSAIVGRGYALEATA
jgi:hypothetical protein